jgi:hypothetical protein
MLLFCPHCDDVIEILGLAPRPLPECKACGAELELVADLEAIKTFKTSFAAIFGEGER